MRGSCRSRGSCDFCLITELLVRHFERGASFLLQDTEMHLCGNEGKALQRRLLKNLETKMPGLNAMHLTPKPG